MGLQRPEVRRAGWHGLHKSGIRVLAQVVQFGCQDTHLRGACMCIQRGLYITRHARGAVWKRRVSPVIHSPSARTGHSVQLTPHIGIQLSSKGAAEGAAKTGAGKVPAVVPQSSSATAAGWICPSAQTHPPRRPHRSIT